VQVTPTRPNAELRLDQLVKLTGMSPLLIRAWERRYGVPAAERTEGGHRRYTREQAELLRRAALLVRSGLRARDAIKRAQSEEPHAAQSDPRGVAQVTELLLAGDVARALDHLRGAWLTIGLDATLEELVFPALREVGEGWATERYSVADEHVATGVVMSWLGAVRAELPSTDLGRPRYLIATPEAPLGTFPITARVVAGTQGTVLVVTHGGVMPKLLEWCDEAAVVHWTQLTDTLPSWQEAHYRMMKEGRPSKVKHPSSAQVVYEIPEPRVGRIERTLRPAKPDGA